MITLGIDTSNYTTSCALYDSDSDKIIQNKRLLPVKSGEKGLRQNDAVFHHTQQLHFLLNELFAEFEGKIDAVGVSSKPRDAEGSYMPCFTVGINVADSIASLMRIPLFDFSHQAGHIVAAAYSAGRLELLCGEFIAFHISGGTTEGLLVSPDSDRIISERIIAETADINCGQVIDRCGVMLGLDFPCGPALEILAESSKKYIKPPKVSFKDGKCNLSGLENKCRDLLNNGTAKSEIALYCLNVVGETVSAMTDYCIKEYGDYPVLYAGGVMGNKIIKKMLEGRFEALFADPAYSSDNAAGTAILTYLKVKNNA